MDIGSMSPVGIAGVAHGTARPYVYWATVVRVIDGDSIVCDVDLGFGLIKHLQEFRLAGCNARELHEPGGPEARDHLTQLLAGYPTVLLASIKPDKFGGRFDAAVTLPDGSDLTQTLVAQQWAAPWGGAGPRPVPPWPRTVTP